MADELPMVYTASWCLFVLLETEPGFKRPSLYARALLGGTVLFNALFTWS
jgi:dihydroceramidase